MPFYLEGEGGLYEFVERRLQENGHMVIVVAEGAGQELMEASSTLRDASGNQLLHDIGLWLSQKLKVCLHCMPHMLRAHFLRFSEVYNHTDDFIYIRVAFLQPKRRV